MILAAARIKFVTYSLKTHVETIRFRKKYTFFYKTAILSRFHRLTSEGGYSYLLKEVFENSITTIRYKTYIFELDHYCAMMKQFERRYFRMTNNFADCAMTIYKIMILLATGPSVIWVGEIPMKDN